MTHGPTVIVQRPNALFGGIMVVEKQLCLSNAQEEEEEEEEAKNTRTHGNAINS
jgi:hypothetical protein